MKIQATTQKMILGHFGTSSDYPALKVDFDRSSSATWEEFGDQRPSAPSLEIRSFSPGSGAVGDPIKIAGTGFSTTVREDSISFGGTTYVVANNFIDDTRPGIDPTIDTLVVNVPTYAQTGEIMVKVLDGQPATSLGVFEVLSTPSLSAPRVKSVIRVYPNPTSGELRFTNLSTTNTYAYKAYSLLGKEIISGTVQGSSVIDMSSLTDGQYILVLQTEGKELLRTRLLMLKK